MTTVQVMLPDEVKDEVTKVAKRQHITLQEFMAMALLEKLSSQSDRKLEKRASVGKRSDFDEFMAQVPDVEPEDYDKIR